MDQKLTGGIKDKKVNAVLNLVEKKTLNSILSFLTLNILDEQQISGAMFTPCYLKGQRLLPLDPKQ